MKIRIYNTLLVCSISTILLTACGGSSSRPDTSTQTTSVTTGTGTTTGTNTNPTTLQSIFQASSNGESISLAGSDIASQITAAFGNPNDDPIALATGASLADILP